MNIVIKDSKGVHLEYDNFVSRTVAIGNLSLLFLSRVVCHCSWSKLE